MPTLNWIGKEAVVNHDKEVPFRLLKKVKSYSVGENSQNLIIKGDNLEGLKALMPYYIGKVKCIYIDPPYNTGNESWVYNDKVNSPKIKKWLGKVVGGEAQDLCRHDKWLCMMYPRLKLLKDLLSDDGVIFISIDDNEQAHLKLLMDEVFGEENFVTNIIWQKKTGASDAKNVATITEYILIYTKQIGFSETIFRKNKESYDINRYKYKDEYFSERGPYYIDNLDRGGLQYSDSLNFAIKCPDGKITYPNGRKEFKKDGWIWKWSENKIKWAIENEFIEFRKSKTKESGWSVCYKNYLSVNNKGERIERSAPIKNLIDGVLNADASANIKELFGEGVFKYSKPKELIKKLIDFVNLNSDDIILDSFAGSGTTGHAVLDLNKEDGGNRKFILIEMEDDIAKKITAERIKRAIKKYDYKDGFEYCELDKPLFDENGQIEETCDFNQFATYIYFTETQTNIDKKQIDKNFIGESGETEYYLIYKEKYKNVLDKKFLSKIKKTNNKKVIYADFCMIDEDEIKKYNIQFKQIPYEVKVY